MDRKRLRLLLIDDSEADAERLLRELLSAGYDPISMRVENAQALSRALQDGSWDLAVCDYSMPTFSGADALRKVKEKDPTLPFLFVSGTLPVDLARKLQADGAAGVVSKDNLASFLPAIELILNGKQSRAEAPESLDSLKNERTQLRQQVEILERMIAELKAKLDRGARVSWEMAGPKALPKPKILLVDDRSDNLTALEAIVSDCGAATVRANSGREALERLLNEDFALILMDVRMPEMDGFETARLIHRRTRSRATPIVFLTAAGDDSMSILRGYEAGAVDYLPKPLVPEILQAKVHIFLELHAKSELLRRQAEHLAALNRELEAFSGTVSHDLKAPLRAIRSWTQILFEEYRGKTLDAEAEETIKRILDSGRRMDALIQSLLDYAKISRAEITIDLVDLDEVVREAMGYVTPELDARQAQVRVEGPLGMVKAHRTSLVQAVVNLISNANKFTAPGCRPVVTLRAEARAGRRRLWVEDSGIGIAAEDQDRIFRPFERLHRQAEYYGHGMGLAIVQRAVERVGGTVGVESTVGQGSRFWLELPSA
jgi:two-component system, sensor histidine kinase and response regulator